MGWRDNRRRSVCKKIMFTPEEWEQTRRIHERWARNIPVYRRWGDFARQTLMHGALMNVSVTLASDPEVVKAELHHIGVNVNQIARIANLTGSVSPQQMRELHDLLALIDERMTGMEREKAEIAIARVRTRQTRELLAAVRHDHAPATARLDLRDTPRDQLEIIPAEGTRLSR